MKGKIRLSEHAQLAALGTRFSYVEVILADAAELFRIWNRIRGTDISDRREEQIDLSQLQTATDDRLVTSPSPFPVIERAFDSVFG